MTKEDFYRRKYWLLGVAVASGAIMMYFFEEYRGLNIISFLFGLIFFTSFGLYTWVTWNDERGGGDGGF
tara:strand:- start:47 stop:253 length:207 start_codon:yes stop_codon:yes gene_type:complete